MGRRSTVPPSLRQSDVAYFVDPPSGPFDPDGVEDRQRRFLEAFRKEPRIGKAAEASGVSRQHTHAWRKAWPSFAFEFQMIRDRHHVDRLVEAMEAAA